MHATSSFAIGRDQAAIGRRNDVPDEAEWMAHGTAALNYLNFDEEELAELQCDVEEDLNTIRLDRS